jgi:asparagine synthase (glutamine-hydrolysing)
MSGIIGIWNRDGRPVEEAVLSGMSATLAHRGPDGEGVWIQGPVGLACQLLRVTPEATTETQPLVHASGTALVFDGRLDNRGELLASLTASPGISPESPDPALILAAYEAFGERFPERLNGDFALGLFDPNRRRLLLARDALGIRPLYYARPRDTFLFASEIKALLAHPQVSSRANDDNLAEFLLGGLALDNEGWTFFEGVRSLLPGYMAVLTPSGFVTQRYWDFEPTRRVRLSSFPEYVEAFRHYFEQAVRRRLRSAYPVAVSVSGGMDSSSIFCTAETLRRRAPERYPPLLGISYTSDEGSPSDEKAFLLDIERDYGVRIERIPMGLGLMNGCMEAVWHSEVPLLDDQWNTTRESMRTLHRLGARVLLTGHWGDQVLFDQAYLTDLFRGLAWGTVWAHLREFGHWLTDVNPRWFWRSFMVDLVRYHVPDALVPCLRRLRAKLVRSAWDDPFYTEAFRKQSRQHASKHTAIEGQFATVLARSLYGGIRSKFHVSCMEWNNKVAAMHGLEMAFPFLDRDLFCFLMGSPGEMLTWNGVPKAILREAMRGVLPEAIVERRYKADFTDQVGDGMDRDYPQIVDCLRSGGMAAKMGYVDGDVMMEELTRLKGQIRGTGSLITWSLSRLIGLELWLQNFCGEERKSQGGFRYAKAR